MQQKGPAEMRNVRGVCSWVLLPGPGDEGECTSVPATCQRTPILSAFFFGSSPDFVDGDRKMEIDIAISFHLDTEPSSE
jgi:hypothetical protein